LVYSRPVISLMARNQNPENVIEGEVLESLPSLKFKVKLEDGREILAYLAGRLRMFKIRILPGDKVQVEMSPYDQTKGRIVYRNK
jgi:translation initiation factor IF-1